MNMIMITQYLVLMTGELYNDAIRKVRERVLIRTYNILIRNSFTEINLY